MYSQTDLTREINELILAMQERNEPRMHPDWITQEIMLRHPGIEGEDSDFYTLTARSHVRDSVRQALNRFKVKPELVANSQITLEGFERLQRYYLADEDGAQVAVRVQDMTERQLADKAAELRAMGAGCYQHADEIERYHAQRRMAA